MHLQDLKKKKTHELLELAVEHEIENAANMRRQDIMFSILKSVADKGASIHGDGVIDILQDGFGFLRAPESNYLPGPDDIYVSPSQIRRFGLRNGDTVEGEIRQPKDNDAPQEPQQPCYPQRQPQVAAQDQRRVHLERLRVVLCSLRTDVVCPEIERL